MKEACHEWKLANYKVVNGCTLLGLTEESEFPSWEEMMGKDPVHLTGVGHAKLANEIVRMAEGPVTVFSGGKRAHDGEDDRPPPSSAAGSSGSIPLPLVVAAAAAGAALPVTVAAAVVVRPEEGRPQEDTAEGPAISWEATPAREGKL